jgi:polysaccharide biosynthesis transport protein
METESSGSYREYIEEIDPQRYWLILKRRWLPATGVFLLFVAAAAVPAFLRKPSFEAAGKLLFERRNPTTELTGIGKQLNAEGEKSGGNAPIESYLATQSVVLQSRPLVEQTIKALNLRDKAGELVGVDAFARGLKIKPLTGTDILEVSFLSSDPQLAAAVVNHLMTAYVKGDVVANRAAASTARSFLDTQLPQGELALTRAAEDLRQFKQKYKVASLEQERTAAVSQIQTIDQQLNLAQTQLANAEARGAELQRQLGLNPTQAIALSTLSQTPGIQQAQTDLQKLQTEIASKREVYTDDSPFLAELVSQEASQRALLQERIEQVMGAKIAVNPASLQIDPLKQQLTANLATVEADRLSAGRQIQVLEQSRVEYRQRLKAFPNLEKTQQLLEGRLESAKTSYDTLLARAKETQLVENQSIGNAHIIEQAIVPLLPTGSGKLKFIVAGVVVGLLLGVATALLLDLIDKTIKTAKEAEALLGYSPILGLVPRFKTSDHSDSEHLPPGIKQFSARIVSLYDPQSYAGSAYQMLQANLRFLSSDKRLRAIVITSSVSEEGKTEVAANLATTLAQSGRRVLLVDADMRSPAQHHLWNLTNQTGLSHVLVGVGMMEQALERVLPNLTILTAGVTPPNPLALIDSEKMNMVVNQLLREFEYIIFDTPPLSDAADAAVLGKAADGILMVVRPRLVTSAEAIAAKTLLSRSNAEVLGMVANGVHVNGEHEELTLTPTLRQPAYNDASDAPTILY